MRTLIYLITFLGFCHIDISPSVKHEFRFYKTMIVDGEERTYTLNLPPHYYESASGFPVVLALHGGGGNADQFERTSGLSMKANTAGYIIVYPNGVKGKRILKLQTWNAGHCCGQASKDKIDDVKFIKKLIDELAAKYKIDTKRVYATGHSNGGMMSYRLACEMSDRIAAIAVSSCTMVVFGCNPTRPVPILHMHDVRDTTVPYQGGNGKGLTKSYYFPPVDSVLAAWSASNSCEGEKMIMHDKEGYQQKEWYDCSNGASIQFYLTSDGGHGWPGGLPGGKFSDTPSKAIHANDLVFEFFGRHFLE